MKRLCLLGLSILLALHATRTLAQNSAQDLKTYLPLRDQLKAMDLATLKSIASSPRETNAKRGLASYYIFLKTPLPEGDAAAAKKSVNDLEEAASAYMDPLCYVKLALFYSQDNPKFDAKQDRDKALKYLSVAWEMADLSDKATGDNALLTLIINNTLGIGDGLLADSANGKFAMKDSLDFLRSSVLRERAKFKKLYQLSVKDEFPGSTNVERHYAH